MRLSLPTICGLAVCALLGAGCAASPGYSPPPERRASDRCPAGETWICRDRHPSRLGRENEAGMICYCDAVFRVR